MFLQTSNNFAENFTAFCIFSRLLELFFAQKQIKEQFEIGSQTKKRILERGRLVFFEEKMTNPRKAIPHKRNGNQPGIIGSKNPCKKD